MIRYEDAHYYYVWKPHDIPTTYGNEYSFLERIVDEQPSFFRRLQEIFNEKQEYGLVNRLDNDTAGLLYFAKTHADYEAYEQAQKIESLYKIYLCDLQ
ncbi:MAG: pseudouridine synthase [bacterium]